MTSVHSWSVWPLAQHGVYRSKEWKKTMAKIYESSQAGDGVFNLCRCSHCREIRGGSHDRGEMWFRHNYSLGNTPQWQTWRKATKVLSWGGGLSQVLDFTAGTKTGSGDPAVPKSISRQVVNNSTLQYLYDEISSRMGDKSDLHVYAYSTKHILLCCSWQLEHQRGAADLIILLVWKLVNNSITSRFD